MKCSLSDRVILIVLYEAFALSLQISAHQQLIQLPETAAVLQRSVLSVGCRWDPMSVSTLTLRETVYKCWICDLRTRDKSDMNRHVRVHTGEKPFSCPHCPYRSAQKLSIHIRRKHKGELRFFAWLPKCVFCQPAAGDLWSNYAELPVFEFESGR